MCTGIVAAGKGQENRCLVIFCCRVVVPALIVAVCVGIVAVIVAGPWALAYIPLYVLATLPGWPIGRALFDRLPEFARLRRLLYAEEA